MGNLNDCLSVKKKKKIFQRHPELSVLVRSQWIIIQQFSPMNKDWAHPKGMISISINSSKKWCQRLWKYLLTLSNHYIGNACLIYSMFIYNPPNVTKSAPTRHETTLIWVYNGQYKFSKTMSQNFIQNFNIHTGNEMGW